jgi:hypothetical protein
MGLDTSIALQGRAPQLDNPMDLQAKALSLKQLGLATDSAQLEANQQRTLADLYRQNTNPDGTVNQEGVLQGMAKSGLGARIPAYQTQMLAMRKGQADLEGTQAKTKETQFDTHKKNLDLIGGTLSSLVSKPDLTHDDAIAALNGLVDQGAITPEQGAQAARNLPGRPEQLRPFLVQQGLQTMDAAKRMELLTPKYNEQDTGAVINQGTIDPLTGTRTAGVNVTKTMTPDQAAKVKIMNERGTFTAEAGDLLASLAAKGVSLPAGMRSKEQQISTINGLIRKFPGMTADEIADGVATGQINFGAAKKEITVAAGQAGKVSVAANELKTFGDQVLEASAAVPRGNFIPVGKLLQMADSSISDPALLRFKAKMQALNSAYDQLAARGGTDAEKRAHIHELFQTAAGPEAVQALVQALREESDGALAAAAKAQEYHPPSNTPKGGAAVPKDIADLLKKHGGG